jgi:hypothetical protein
VYMCVYVCICVYMCVYACMRVCMCVYAYMCVCGHTKSVFDIHVTLKAGPQGVILSMSHELMGKMYVYPFRIVFQQCV